MCIAFHIKSLAGCVCSQLCYHISRQFMHRVAWVCGFDACSMLAATAARSAEVAPSASVITASVGTQAVGVPKFRCDKPPPFCKRVSPYHCCCPTDQSLEHHDGCMVLQYWGVSQFSVVCRLAVAGASAGAS